MVRYTGRHLRKEPSCPDTRLRNERLFHDQQAAERARALQPDQYQSSDESYLRTRIHGSAPAIDALGDLAGKRVLDLGCGHGMASIVLGELRGALVTACDLSLGYLRKLEPAPDANHVHDTFIVCNGERLPFADASFRPYLGQRDLAPFGSDSRRARTSSRARAGRIAVFCEPWGGNRWLNWARQRLHYPGKQRTADETPLRPCDLACMRGVSLDARSGYQLSRCWGGRRTRPFGVWFGVVG